MNLLFLLSGAAIFLLALSSGIFAGILYVLTVTGTFALLVANDYRPRPPGYNRSRSAAASQRERLPLAV